MIKKINRTEAFKAKMKTEGKVTTLNEAQHMSAIATMNSRLESVRRDYQLKDRNSQITASNVILTA